MPGVMCFGRTGERPDYYSVSVCMVNGAYGDNKAYKVDKVYKDDKDEKAYKAYKAY